MSVAMMGSGGGGKLHFLDLGVNKTFDFCFLQKL